MIDSSREQIAGLGSPKTDPPEPLRELYLRHRTELIAFVRHRFGAGPPEPEDIAQQAFANFAAIRCVARIANPRAFLFRIARNLVINDRKRQRVGQRFFEPAPAAGEICEARDDFNPEVVVLGREQYRLIEQAIRAMPWKRRSILMMNRFDGLSYAEIARRLGLSESVVRKHTAVAIRECAAVLMSEAPGAGRKEDQ